MSMKFYKCKKCGRVATFLTNQMHDSECCDESMVELKPNTTDAATEKHVPVVSQNGNLVEVTVGSVIHPMEEKHYIQWIALETKNLTQIKYLNPGDQPKAVFALAEGDEVVRAYEYCNLHGLWADK